MVVFVCVFMLNSSLDLQNSLQQATSQAMKIMGLLLSIFQYCNLNFSCLVYILYVLLLLLLLICDKLISCSGSAFCLKLSEC